MTNRAPCLQAEGLRVELGGFAVVQDLSVQVATGELVAILGPNGSGKTTFLRALAGLERRQRGSVRLEGQAIEDLSPSERARRLALVPSRSQLAARLSARAVVEMGRFPHRGDRPGLGPADHAAIDAAMAATDSAYLIERPFTVLSAGEQQRILIARALATEAPLLLLDEPTANLDIAHQIGLMTLLRRLADHGHAVVAVLHDLETARSWADRALLIDCGLAVAAGSLAEVLTPEHVRQVYRVEPSPNAATAYRLCDGKPT